MGKARNKNDKSHRSDPLSKPVKPPADLQLAALREEKILPIIAKLRDADPNVRTQASGAVSSIVSDSKCRKLLLREKIVHVILQETLTDASPESRAVGWMILSSLIQKEELDFCVHLYRLDILTPMAQASETVASLLANFDKSSKHEKHYIFSIATTLVLLISTLATARDEILEALLSNATMTKLLFRLITSKHTPPDLMADALHCLWAMSEIDARVIEMILTDSEINVYKCLKEPKQNVCSPRAVCSAALLHSIYSSHGWDERNPGPEGETDLQNLEYLSTVVKQIEMHEALRDTGSSRWDHRLTLLEVALEVIGSIATSFQESLGDGKDAEKAQVEDGEDDPEGDDEEDEWNGFDDDDTMAVDEEEDEAKTGGAGSAEGDEMDVDGNEGVEVAAENMISREMQTLEGLFNIVPRLVSIAMTGHKEEAKDPGRSGSVHQLALGAVNNIAWTVAMFDLSGRQKKRIRAKWQPLGALIWKKMVSVILASDTDDVEIASMITSIAWAVAKSLGGKVPLAHKEQNSFIALYMSLKGAPAAEGAEQKVEDSEDPFQHPGVKCVGVLGELARDPAPAELNKEILGFLMRVSLEDESRPAETLEALNQILDIYADDKKPCEEVFWQQDGLVLEKLREALDGARVLAKEIDRRKQPELRDRADEVVVNLFRFVQYKTKVKEKRVRRASSAT